MRFTIYNPASGLVLGEYDGATPADALDALARDAGYTDYRAACDVTGDDPDDPDLRVVASPYGETAVSLVTRWRSERQARAMFEHARRAFNGEE